MREHVYTGVLSLSAPRVDSPFVASLDWCPEASYGSSVTPSTPPWTRVKSEFTNDGTVRDIYVRGATRAVWDVVLKFVAERYPKLAFTAGGRAAPLPTAAVEVFGLWDAAPLIELDVDGLTILCHFFSTEEIEFNIWPQDVDSEARFGALIQFLRDLATATGMEAIVTPESYPQSVILSVEPATLNVSYHPPPDT